MKFHVKEPKPTDGLPLVTLPTDYFLEGTEYRRHKVAFVMKGGGLGDYINYMSAFLWLAEKCPQVKGFLYCNPPFLDVARYIMQDFKHWKVRPIEVLPNIEPGVHIVRREKQAINATNAHLMDVGFAYFAMHSEPFDGYGFLPEINYETPITETLPKPYAVFTPGYTAASRAIPPEAFNEITSYTKSLGITPVYLGKRIFSNTEAAKRVGYTAKINEEIDLSNGVDLTEKTTLLEAIGIMSKAEFVCGLDNGLLHMAGTTEVPIIFGHTITEIKYRNIRRRKGKTLNIALTKDALSCAGCLNNMRFIWDHSFNNCLYGHFNCLKILFGNNCETWKKAINHLVTLKKSANPIGK